MSIEISRAFTPEVEKGLALYTELDKRYRQHLQGNLDLLKKEYPQIFDDSEKFYKALEKDGLLGRIDISPLSLLYCLTPGPHRESEISTAIISSPNASVYKEIFEKYENFSSHVVCENIISDIFSTSFSVVSSLNYMEKTVDRRDFYARSSLLE